MSGRLRASISRRPSVFSSSSSADDIACSIFLWVPLLPPADAAADVVSLFAGVSTWPFSVCCGRLGYFVVGVRPESEVADRALFFAEMPGAIQWQIESLGVSDFVSTPNTIGPSLSAPLGCYLSALRSHYHLGFRCEPFPGHEKHHEKSLTLRINLDPKGDPNVPQELFLGHLSRPLGIHGQPLAAVM